MTKNTLTYLYNTWWREIEQAKLQNEIAKLAETIRNNNLVHAINQEKNAIQRMEANQLNFRELKKLGETMRHNLQQEIETNRSNIANESIKQAQNAISKYDAETKRLEAEIKAKQLDLNDREVVTKEKHVVTDMVSAGIRGLGASALGYAFGKGSAAGTAAAGASELAKLHAKVVASTGGPSAAVKFAKMAGLVGAGILGTGLGFSLGETKIGDSSLEKNYNLTEISSLPNTNQTIITDHETAKKKRRQKIGNEKRYQFYRKQAELAENQFNEVPTDFSNSKGPGGKNESFITQNENVPTSGLSSGTFATSVGSPPSYQSEDNGQSNVIYSGSSSKTKENSGPGVGLAFQ